MSEIGSGGEAAIIAGLVSTLVAVISMITSVGLAASQLRQATTRLRREFQLEFAAETAAHALLEDPRWELRTFDTIKRHLGGFEENELRKLLARAGAIRFTSRTGDELWGLLSRNREKLGVNDIATPGPALTALGLAAAAADMPDARPSAMNPAAAPAPLRED